MRNPLFVLSITLIFITLPCVTQAKVLDIQEVKSKSGLSAWLVEDHSVPVIALNFSFLNAGARNDPADKQGLARLAANTMDEGAGDLDSRSFQKELQDLSISLSFSADRDHFGGGVQTLTRNRDRAFALLKLALTKPRFDEEPLGRMRAANQARIKSSLVDPDWIAARLQNDRIFADHPYALNSGGTLSTLENVTAADLKDFHKTLGKNILIVSAAGDITAPELAALLDDVFGNLPVVEKKESAPFPLQNAGKTYIYRQDIPQTVVSVAQKGLSRRDSGFQTAQIMNFILGAAGFGSRLMEEVREKRGLTYGIYTGFQNYEQTDVLQLSTSTANENTKKVLELIKAEWRKMINTPVTETELENAKSYLIGSLPLSLTSTGAISGLLLSLQQDGLPIDYLEQRENNIKSATVKDVRDMAQNLLDTDGLTVILVGNPGDIENAETIETLPNVE